MFFWLIVRCRFRRAVFLDRYALAAYQVTVLVQLLNSLA